MQKWEYTVLVTKKPLVQELNSMGAEGWEAIHFDLYDPNGDVEEIERGENEQVVFFKRLLAE